MSLDIWLFVEVDTGGPEPRQFEITEDFNITHNVAPMWRKAGIYDELYNSRDKQAGETLDALKSGLAAMIADPDGFRELNPSNGWGSYDGAVRWLTHWIEACEEHPKAVIGLSK